MNKNSALDEEESAFFSHDDLKIVGMMMAGIEKNKDRFVKFQPLI